ncbi:hypothetical protein [Roseomonas sp. KE0001]|uniref:hypothetical protein n=1 Tax=unclassified Roseomonas TaxID=2617492 RepID=UPI0018DF7640|nr:hypothetical protein [Roseomonas sp. KE0001]MBI0435314.1 hypothetical protein [Roseomonas sp. KE0001]
MDQRRPLPELRPDTGLAASGRRRDARGPFRRLALHGLTGLLTAATLLAGTGAMATSFRCATPEQQAMFEIAALKTELMVIATTCNTEAPYNAFITRYKPVLSSNDMAVIGHFTARDRRAGQRENDVFITNLANARAQEANRVGADFCSRNARLFEEVMSLPGAAELGPYAASKDLLPASLGSCVPSASSPAPARSATSSRRASR